MQTQKDTKNRLSCLMTVYNEADFVEYAIRAALPYVDHLYIVEGAYQETIRCGAEPKSTDGTVDEILHIIQNTGYGLTADDKSDALNDIIHLYIEVNKETDKDQRNFGLQKIKELNPDGWLLIIDGDEVYTPENFKMVRNFMKTMERDNKRAAYFKSLTFVNDARTYCEQEFPRLFKITPGCKFINDNYMQWEDAGWTDQHVIKIPYLKYHHYSFAKNSERSKLKKKWWENRFEKDFEYDWYQDEKGKWYSPNHRLFKYTGRHPDVMKDHPLLTGGIDEQEI